MVWGSKELFKNLPPDFPGGTVAKNLPANAGDMGSIPGLGSPQLLSPCTTSIEARAPTTHAPQQKQPLQWEAHTLQWRVAPACHN